MLDEAGGSIAYRFHARDAHLVLRPERASRSRSGCCLDGEAPGASHGVDVDEDGNGVLRDGRLYQLVRAARPGRASGRSRSRSSARRRGVRLHVRIGAP